MKKSVRFFMSLLLPAMMFAASPALTQDTKAPPAAKAKKGASLKGQLVGAWTLVSLEVTPKGAAKRPGLGGPNPKGVLILDASGRYANVFGRPDRPKFKPSANLRADTPAAEFGEAARAFAANFGTWSVNEADKTLIRKYELALIPNNDNNETKASITLSKGELKLVQVSATGTTTESVYRRAK